MITYRLLRVSAERAVIVRGRKNVGTITLIKGVWHGRFRVAGRDAIVASGPDVVVVFNGLIDQRVAS
jgi:hypothetical protein